MTNLYNAIMQKRAEFTGRMGRAPSIIYLGRKEMLLTKEDVRVSGTVKEIAGTVKGIAGMKILKVDADSHVGVGE